MQTERNAGNAEQSWNKGPWKETVLTFPTFQYFSAVSSNKLTSEQERKDDNLLSS
jgi:hypothetical protein